MNDTFLRACRREPVDHPPVWLMRQAGRYMAEYRAIRERYSFLEMVKTPDVAAEVTLQPIEAFNLDAAIIFADILPPLEGMGLHLTFEKGEGPVLHNPPRSPADIEALRQPDPRESVAFTIEAIRLVKRSLEGRIPLIGFSGAPFTLASYAIEGGSSRDYRYAKGLMYRHPQAWHLLMDKLTTLVSDYLLAQVEAGADAVQLFDSWAGALAPNDYAEYVLPYVQQSIARVRAQSQVPVIYFGTDMNGLLPLLRQTGADVLGADWRIALDDFWSQVGDGFAVQGNLDPVVLFAPWPEIERRAADILHRAAGRPGHIFNLGHGILTETPVEHVRQLVEFVHTWTWTRKAGA
ncbi:MAG: uroporphyrinogen decarboxylase [Chloroflexaceae bacterium]|nr:uroporphyrinogen decarboxylase [Chloroflexaceae bacterium]